jgi:uncharacterized protein YgiM (DUF1202 family)
MGWKSLAFLVYIVACVVISVVLGITTVKFLAIESAGLRILLFMILSSLYVGTSVGLSYYVVQSVLVDEKMRILLKRANQCLAQGNVVKAKELLNSVKSLSVQYDQMCSTEIEELDSKIVSSIPKGKKSE